MAVANRHLFKPRPPRRDPAAFASPAAVGTGGWQTTVDERRLAVLRFKARPFVARVRHHPRLFQLRSSALRPEDYTALLTRLYSFQQPLEVYLDRRLAAWRADLMLARRRKGPLLCLDLLTFGVTPQPVAGGPMLDDPAGDDGTAYALGCLYAAETLTLPGCDLAAHAARNLSLSPPNGVRFLMGYGAAAPAMWLALTRCIARAVDACGDDDAAMTGIVDAFATLYRCLSDDTPG